MAERVCEKEKSNFCEYFHFKKKNKFKISVKKDPLADLKRLFTET